MPPNVLLKIIGNEHRASFACECRFHTPSSEVSVAAFRPEPTTGAPDVIPLLSDVVPLRNTSDR